jgi:hypothetical protein
VKQIDFQTELLLAGPMIIKTRLPILITPLCFLETFLSVVCLSEANRFSDRTSFSWSYDHQNKAAHPNHTIVFLRDIPYPIHQSKDVPWLSLLRYALKGHTATFAANTSI